MNLDKSYINTDRECLQPGYILNELERNERGTDLGIFRKLLTCPSRIFVGSWEPVLLELLNVIVYNNGQIEEKRLASQTFSRIFMASCNIDVQRSYFEKILSLDGPQLCVFNSEVDIPEAELFKLIMIHGYLLASNKTSILLDIFTLSFEIIHKYCMRYTRHIYISFQLLDIWLKKSRVFEFWKGNDLEFERKLEAIIFSNWDNCINEIAKINASHLFPLYLEIMRDKYNGFLEYVLSTTMEHMSWQNPTKFVIIAETFKVAADYPKILNLELDIFQSLTKSHLRHVGTKLYITLMEKMNEEQWNESIRDHLYSNAKKLESEDNAGALYVLWELWMKPTMIKFKETIVPSLWVQFCTDGTMKSASYLAKISSELGMSWTQLNSQPQSNLNDDHVAAFERYWTICSRSRVPCIIDVSEEYVKLNVFVAYCHMKDFPKDEERYQLCERFLYYNAKSCSTQFRKGLFEAFKVLFGRVMKIQGDAERSFIGWLHDFIFDCFEPGSCYQRKIIGLKLYEIMLMYTSGAMDSGRKKKRRNWEDNVVLREEMEKCGRWSLGCNFGLFILLKLCLDPIEEIREHSFNIIKNYFNINDLTKEEVETIMLKAIEMKKSSKFYEIAGGVKLILIINEYANNSPGISLHESVFQDAKRSLTLIKQDILSALTEGSDFNASLTVLLELEFKEELKYSDKDFFKRLLALIEDATIFFLSALSPKASDVSYSSSFAEMGIAVEETIKTSAVVYEYDENVLSPAHQMVLSCIWMALKTLCDLSAKISTTVNCYDEVKDSLDIIVCVLMKCRHKGAIEAAGNALGLSVRYLSDKREYHCLIDTYLQKLLGLNSNDKIDSTRRGAGLSIMFHRMISNDDKKTRRLLHMALGTLIKSLRDPAMKSDVGIDSNHDCACARHLHFLRTIVADKTLQSHLVAYLEEISLICFEHLQSREWAIRNGSLQLLGALIPRLVGQSPESDLEFGNGYSVNHFMTHYPTLAEFILQKINDPCAFNIDSNMVATMTLISKMSVGGCDFTDYSSQEYTAKLREAIRSLFGHSVDHVRYAAAKAYAALVSISEIPQELLNMKIEKVGNRSRNFIHGHLMAQICLHLLAEREGVWSRNCPNTKRNMATLVEGGIIQLWRARSMFDGYDPHKTNPHCNVIEATFLQCLKMAQFYCKISHEQFRDVISFTQIFDLAFRAAGSGYRKGGSDFFQQLFELGPSLNSLLGLHHILDVCEEYHYESGQSHECIYYSLKYLRKYIRDENLPEHDTKRILKEFLTYFPSYIRKSIPDYRIAVEFCKIIIHIFTCEEFGVAPWPLVIESCDLREVMDCIATHYKNPEVQHLVLEMRLLMKRMLGKLTPNDIVSSIQYAIDNGDEQKRTWVINTLMRFSKYDFTTEIGWENLVCSFIALLSDENSEVRTHLYEKMRENQWPDNFYYCSTAISMATNCDDNCRHRKYNSVKFSLIPKNLEICLHNAIYSLGRYADNPLSLRDNFKWLPHVVEHNTMSNTNGVESPFDQDETYREMTKTFNIYSKSTMKSIAIEDYTEMLMRKESIFRLYIDFLYCSSSYLNAILQYKVDDYLQYKAELYESEHFPEFERRKNDVGI